MAKKALLGAVSAVLLVAAVVGVAVGVMRSTHRAGDSFSVPSDGGDSLLTSSKSVAALCAPALHRESCEQTLSAAVDGSSNPADVVKAAVKLTLDEIQSAVGRSGDIGKGANDSLTRGAVADCKVLLDDAVQELKSILELAGDFRGLLNRTDDLGHWLTAAMTFLDNCADGFQHPELKSAMVNNLQNATQLSSNALAVVSSLGAAAGKLDVGGFLKAPDARRRRLLQAGGGEAEENAAVYEQDERGFPTWLSAGDRKLLASPRNGDRLQPHAVVAKDGSGHFKSIGEAVNAMPKTYRGRYVIYVKAGVYQETVTIPKDKVNVYMYGDGPKKTVVVGRKSYADGITTQDTATFSSLGAGFICKSMGFSNTAGAERHQAVAFRVQGEFSAFFNCRFDGYQDTLYTQARRQFFRNCVVSGTIDFIFGNSAVVLQNCLIIVRRPMDNQQNTVTAHGRMDRNMKSGIVIQNCRIVPDKRLFADRFKIPSYLGRPWKEFSRTVIMESVIGDLIRPEGWMPWNGDFALKTLYYAEFGNSGPGAGTSGRVKWPGFHVIDRRQAQQFTVAPFINGNLWLKYTRTPHLLGLKH